MHGPKQLMANGAFLFANTQLEVLALSLLRCSGLQHRSSLRSTAASSAAFSSPFVEGKPHSLH